MIPNDSFKAKGCRSLIEEEKTSPKCDIVNNKGNIGTNNCLHETQIDVGKENKVTKIDIIHKNFFQTFEDQTITLIDI